MHEIIKHIGLNVNISFVRNKYHQKFLNERLKFVLKKFLVQINERFKTRSGFGEGKRFT